MALPRMRTIREAAAYIQTQDPGSTIGQAWIRRAIRTSLLPYVESGNRCLIDLDRLEKVLSEQTVVAPPARQPGTIRRIT